MDREVWILLGTRSSARARSAVVCADGVPSRRIVGQDD